MIIVGLTGAAGCGKDTVADYLVKAYGFVKFSFAAELKRAVLDLDPYVNYPPADAWMRLSDAIEILGPEEAKRQVPEVRRLYQVFGTEVMRARDEDFWVNQVQEQILDAKPIPQLIVLSDVRFDNEASWVRTSGFHNRVVDIVRPDNEHSLSEGQAHVSESGVSDALITDRIINNGTLDQLYNAISEVVSA